jgi:hypothetical protein
MGDEKDGTWSMRGEDGKFVQNFSRKTRKEDATSEV